MKRFLVVILVLAMAVGMLSACGKGDGKQQVKDDGVIRVWVGEESVDYYRKVCETYLADHTDFGYKIEVKGMDTGSVAGTISNDPTAAADIFTVAHDNIGKLASAQCAKPITDESLVAQVIADNPESYQKVIYSNLKDLPLLQQIPCNRGAGEVLRGSAGSCKGCRH